ncbi:unnamed protein product [marine sediment metagenome]|uniref:Uncharacterized protein n=1 Tax=marine sediment metagenome TaxID=412755 RepID=X1N1K0_9ZZZZ
MARDSGILALLGLAALVMLSKKNGVSWGGVSWGGWPSYLEGLDAPDRAEEAIPYVRLPGVEPGIPRPLNGGLGVIPPPRGLSGRWIGRKTRGGVTIPSGIKPIPVTPEILRHFTRTKVLTKWERGKTAGGVTVPSGIKPIPVTAEILARYARSE